MIPEQSPSLARAAHGHLSSLASLEPLEASVPGLKQTRSQTSVHARDWVHRSRVITCLADAEGTRLVKRAHRLADCAAFPLLHQNGAGQVVVQLQLCRDRLCPTCQRLRGKGLAEQVERLIAHLDAPRFVTLTLRGRDGEPLATMLDRLASAFRDLRKLARWGKLVAGGVAAVEVTRGASGSRWHAHLHLIVEGLYYAQADLSRDWLLTTGDSVIVDIRAVHSRRTVARYICEYVAKPVSMGSWADDDVREYAEATHGRRLIQTFGTLHGMKTRPEKPTSSTASWKYLTSVHLLHLRAKRGCVLAQRALNMGTCGNRVLRLCLGGSVSMSLVQPSMDAGDLAEFCSLCRQIECLGSEGVPVRVRRAPLERQMVMVEAYAVE